MLRLHNSLTRQVEDFVPADPGRVTMYVCGPTVYDTPHLGNARPAVVFDVLHRLLRERFASVTYARNITDIDDKIIDRARESGESIESLTTRTAGQYRAASAALGIMPPTHEPMATRSIPAIIDMVSLLVSNGHAYHAEGHVLFELSSDPGHGEMAGHDSEDLRAGHRVAVASYKRAPGDFILWKPSTPDQPGWESPWGRGRPGWHVECSAMIRSTFDDPTIDIHGGGADLRFPHHEAEMSQSRCANHAPLARYWVHNGMLLVNGQKMSKSSGNFTTVDDVLAGHSGPVVRLSLLWAHYAQPLNWTDQVLEQAAGALATWHGALDGIDAPAEPGEAAERVLEALEGDLNTPLAIARLHGLARDVRAAAGGERARLAAGMRHAGAVLGLDLTDNAGFLRGGPDAVVADLLAQREKARAARDYAESDRLRDSLAALGIEVRDGKGGTTWSRI